LQRIGHLTVSRGGCKELSPVRPHLTATSYEVDALIKRQTSCYTELHMAMHQAASKACQRVCWDMRRTAASRGPLARACAASAWPPASGAAPWPGPLAQARPAAPPTLPPPSPARARPLTENTGWRASSRAEAQPWQDAAPHRQRLVSNSKAIQPSTPGISESPRSCSQSIHWSSSCKGLVKPIAKC
jgi:hypothetical protein